MYEKKYILLRYEDMLAKPYVELSRLWKFLGVKKMGKTLEKKLLAEMSSNPDEEWQIKRNEGIASFLPKGQAGNWQRLFTSRDKALYKEIAGDVLVKWGYEKDLGW
ncbi:MAG: hypothetical protein DYG86_16945 [Chloroflexi bacterium CFX2]|nr:hypothetical protein [Chloroflexi bacterium CFX2]